MKLRESVKGKPVCLCQQAAACKQNKYLLLASKKFKIIFLKFYFYLHWKLCSSGGKILANPTPNDDNKCSIQTTLPAVRHADVHAKCCGELCAIK